MTTVRQLTVTRQTRFIGQTASVRTARQQTLHHQRAPSPRINIGIRRQAVAPYPSHLRTNPAGFFRPTPGCLRRSHTHGIAPHCPPYGQRRKVVGHLPGRSWGNEMRTGTGQRQVVLGIEYMQGHGEKSNKCQSQCKYNTFRTTSLPVPPDFNRHTPRFCSENNQKTRFFETNLPLHATKETVLPGKRAYFCPVKYQTSIQKT